MNLYTVPRIWSGPVCVMATGPSLTIEDVEYVRGKCPVIIVNDNYQIAPWAEFLYASDNEWWDHYQGVPDFKGIKITRDRNNGLLAAEKWGLNAIHINIDRKGFSKDPACIHSGNNSGYQACNLAVLFGGTKILMLGFDMKGDSHWFGDHPPGIKRRHIYSTWLRKFGEVVQDGFEMVNCSRDTDLKCFRQSTIQEEI